MIKTRNIILAGVAIVALAGCMNPSVVGTAATSLIYGGESVNLANATYAAVDNLTVQTKQRFDRNSPLIVERLVEIPRIRNDKKVTNPKLTDLMTEQIRTRFMQLGYNVVDTTTSTGAKSQGVVFGSYEAYTKTLTVRLQMKDRSSGQLLGLQVYSLPITGDIRRHMDPYSGGIPLYQVRDGMDEIFDR